MNQNFTRLLLTQARNGAALGRDHSPQPQQMTSTPETALDIHQRNKQALIVGAAVTP